MTLSERQLQFRVGMFVLLALGVTVGLVFQFGNLRSQLETRYPLNIHFASAPGVFKGTPVRMNGVTIGRVSEVKIDDSEPGVFVQIEIREPHRLRVGSEPRIVRSLLGDAAIDFIPGRETAYLAAGAKLVGVAPADPFEIVTRMETNVSTTLAAFQSTSNEWTTVGKNLNRLVETNRGNLDQVVEQTVVALAQFTKTMENANRALANANQVIADPATQENFRKTIAAMPELVRETSETIATMKMAVQRADISLRNINELTGPLSKKSVSIAMRLDNTLGHLESFSKELGDFAKLLNHQNGSLQKLVSDPDLYRNLNASASSLAILLRNLDPIIRDVRIFSDKIARHPELIGVGGAFKGSSGLKEVPEVEPGRFQRTTPVRGASYRP